MIRHKLRVLLISFSLAPLLAIGLFAPVALAQTTQQQIDSGLCTGSDLQFTDNPTGGCASSNDATTQINNIIHTIVNLLSVVVGLVAVVMIIVGGLRYITSGGNDTSVTGAKNTILYAVIGLVIVALAQIIVRFVLDRVTNS